MLQDFYETVKRLVTVPTEIVFKNAALTALIKK